MPDAPEHGARFGGDSQGRKPHLADSAQNMRVRRYVRRFRRKTGCLDGRLAVGGIHGRYDGAGHYDASREGKMRGRFNGGRAILPERGRFPAVIPAEPSAAGGVGLSSRRYVNGKSHTPVGATYYDRPLLLWHGQRMTQPCHLKTFRSSRHRRGEAG